MAPPITPTRSRSATVNGSYSHGLPYYGQMSYVSPSHADHYSHTAMSPYDMSLRNSYALAPWHTLQPMNTQSPFDPRLQRHIQTETPTSSPAGPLQDSQSQSVASVEANVDDLLDVSSIPPYSPCFSDHYLVPWRSMRCLSSSFNHRITEDTPSILLVGSRYRSEPAQSDDRSVDPDWTHALPKEWLG